MVTRTSDSRVLVDADLDECLARDGIVSIPMFDPEELRETEAEYWRIVPPGESGLRLDYLRTDTSAKRALAQLAERMWSGVISETFRHHYPVYSSFVVKHPGAGSDLFLHRDLCVDDERHHRTFAMWMPLTATSTALDNGPLAFVRGSQQIQHGGFGPNAAVLFDPYAEYLRTLLEPFDVPAGTCLVYDARMLHASSANNSGAPRLAVGCLLARRDRPVIQVLAAGRRHRLIHEVDRDYFIEQSTDDIKRNGMPARYQVIDAFDEDPEVTDAVLGEALASGAAPRRVVVPQDLVDLVTDSRALLLGDPAAGYLTQDLPLFASDLGALPAHACGLATAAQGPVGAEELRRCGRVVSRECDALVAPLTRRRPMLLRDEMLVAIDPGGRLRLSGSAARWNLHQIRVLDGPPVTAGVMVAGRAGELKPGVVVTLENDHDTVLWNGGPGPLVVLLARRLASRRPASLKGGVADGS